MINIILASEIDAEVLRDVALKAFSDDYILYGLIPPNFDSIEFHKSHIKDGMYYKITDDENIIGGIKLFDLGDNHFRLGAIYVHPDYQNKKIGQKVIQFVESEYPKVKKWILDTPYKSYRNHHFYEKIGYVKVGEYRPEQDKEFCLFVYEKYL